MLNSAQLPNYNNLVHAQRATARPHKMLHFSGSGQIRNQLCRKVSLDTYSYTAAVKGGSRPILPKL